MDLIRSQTNSANDSSGSVWGLPGNTFIALVGSLIASVSLLILLMCAQFNNFLALLIASLPSALTIGYLSAFVIGRPKDYAFDVLDMLVTGSGISINPLYQPNHPLEIKEVKSDVSLDRTKRLFRR